MNGRCLTKMFLKLFKHSSASSGLGSRARQKVDLGVILLKGDETEEEDVAGVRLDPGSPLPLGEGLWVNWPWSNLLLAAEPGVVSRPPFARLSNDELIKGGLCIPGTLADFKNATRPSNFSSSFDVSCAEGFCNFDARCLRAGGDGRQTFFMRWHL
jgi:hypothetical protein